MKEGLLPNEILLPASRVHPEPAWCDYSRYTWMAIDQQSMNNLLIGNLLGPQSPEDTAIRKPINAQLPNLACTRDPTKTKPHRKVVKNAGGKANGKATGLYNKYQKDSEQPQQRNIPFT
jgi:hypothetical protein